MGKVRRQKSAAGSPAKLTPEERTALCVQYVQLDEERLGFQRQETARENAQRRIERKLTEQLRLDKKWDQTIGKDFEFGIELTDGSLYYKGELISALGQAEFDRRVKDAPQRSTFYIRDNRPPEARQPATPAPKAKKPRGKRPPKAA